ncbi:MAG: zf-HC2 domain-containing protein [Thermoanaerobaculia bacterium]
MDHALIDENQVADRYLMGKLAEDERCRFEDHLVGCPRCLDALEALEGLRDGLKELPAVETAQVPDSVALPPQSLPGSGRPMIAFLAAACLLLGILVSAFFYRELRRTRQELADARKLSSQSQRSEAELRQVLERGRTVAAPLAASVFSLNLTRGVPSSEPENRVLLGKSSGWVVLAFDRPDLPGFSSYQVRLSGADGHPVGNTVKLEATTGETLAVSLPASLLTPGDYALTVEGLGPAAVEPLAVYRFRVVSRK